MLKVTLAIFTVLALGYSASVSAMLVSPKMVAERRCKNSPMPDESFEACMARVEKEVYEEYRKIPLSQSTRM